MLAHLIKYPNQHRNITRLKRIEEEDGIKSPFLSSMPIISFTSKLFWDAFEYLSEKRIRNETGPQHIQVSDMLAYAQLRGIRDADELNDLLDYLLVLDREWLKDAYAKKAKAEKKAREEAARRRARRR